jgi:hypothetical protein
VLREARAIGCPWGGLETFTDSLEKFRYGALTNPELLSAEKYDSGWNSGMACTTEASKGNLDVVREARAFGCPWGDTAVEACRNEHLQLLRWARGPPAASRRVPLYAMCYRVAAEGGHLDVIKFLREEQCEYINNRAANAAAQFGHPRCLELLYEICAENEGRWSPDDVCAHAVTSEQIDVLKTAWALEPERYNAFKYEDPFTTFNVKPMQWAASRGRIDMMEWLLDNGCPWGSYTCGVIAKRGDPAVSKWAAEAPNGCRCNSPFGTTMTSKCTVHGDPWI